MRRLATGIMVVSIVAIFFLWFVIKLAFVTLQLAISLAVFIFCVYVLYVFWGVIVDMFRGKNNQ